MSPQTLGPQGPAWPHPASEGEPAKAFRPPCPGRPGPAAPALHHSPKDSPQRGRRPRGCRLPRRAVTVTGASHNPSGTYETVLGPQCEQARRARAQKPLPCSPRGPRPPETDSRAPLPQPFLGPGVLPEPAWHVLPLTLGKPLPPFKRKEFLRSGKNGAVTEINALRPRDSTQDVDETHWLHLH